MKRERVILAQLDDHRVHRFGYLEFGSAIGGLVKWLISPHSTNPSVGGLVAVLLVAVGEELDPRVLRTVLR